KSTYSHYLDHLLKQRGVKKEEAKALRNARREEYEVELAEARRDDFIRCVDKLGGVWSGFAGGPRTNADEPDTSVSIDKLARLLNDLTQVPADFQVHPKLQRLMETRRDMAAGDKPLDWGAAEAVAFASLVADGVRLRMTGQDVCRGTFSHRHAVLYDYE